MDEPGLVNGRGVSRRQVGGLLSAALAGGACGAASASAPSLDALARAKGLRFGSMLGRAVGRRAGSFDDRACRALTARECSVLVLENETKWPQLCPDPRQPHRFGPADEMFAWGRAQGMTLRGHTLLWMPPPWLPKWLGELNFGAQPGRLAQTLLAHHIRSTCSHFGDTIESWDVVNEAVEPATGAWRDNLLVQRFGGDAVGLIAQAFHLAREHAPGAQLVYNDFMDWGEGNAAHRAGVLRLLAELRRRDVPVDALGVQAHIGAWSLPAAGGPEAAGRAARTTRATQWRRFLDEVTGMGLDILVTEFDVNDRALPSDPALRDAGVAAVARDWLDATLDCPRLRRLLCWGLADHHSWLQADAHRADGLPRRPLPYDDQLRPKPLREAIAGALRAMPPR
jgi:endo-1,4-beta-xylanase